MQDIKQREEKIKEKRKQTSFRDFVKDICSWKNLGFYKHGNDISRFPVSERSTSIQRDIFNETWDDITKYGIAYVPGTPFFDQFGELFRKVPLPAVVHIWESENSDYTDISGGAKNAYLGFTIFNKCENVAYSESVKDYCNNVFNSMTVWDGCDNIYNSIAIFRSQNIFYSRYITDSYNIYFSSNMRNCQECLFCDGLDNQSYHIENVAYAKEVYFQKKQDILKEKDKFSLYFSKVSTQSLNYGSDDVQGRSIIRSDHIQDGYYVYRLHNGRNVFSSGSAEGNQNFYDCIDVGSPYGQDFYGIMGAGSSENIFCSVSVNRCTNIYYSYYMNECSYCLGCVGLKNKQFCILNKEYTQEERFKIAHDIFQKMSDDNTLGNFLPGTINPFYFNDTAAYLIDDSFTEEEVANLGYLRRDEGIKVDIPVNAEIIDIHEMHNFQGFVGEGGSRRIDPEILKKVIKDGKGNYYRIVPMELDFLQKHGLPLPEIHWLERIKLGFKLK